MLEPCFLRGVARGPDATYLKLLSYIFLENGWCIYVCNMHRNTQDKRNNNNNNNNNSNHSKRQLSLKKIPPSQIQVPLLTRRAQFVQQYRHPLMEEQGLLMAISPEIIFVSLPFVTQ